MLTTQRKQLILQRLQQEGQIVAKAFSEELGISEDAVPRELAGEGQLQRVNGGALPASAAIGDMQVRVALAPDEKRALGRTGAVRLGGDPGLRYHIAAGGAAPGHAGETFTSYKLELLNVVQR